MLLGKEIYTYDMFFYKCSQCKQTQKRVKSSPDYRLHILRNDFSDIKEKHMSAYVLLYFHTSFHLFPLVQPHKDLNWAIRETDMLI